MPPASLKRLFAIARDHLGLNIRSIDARVTRRMFLKNASVRNCDGTCCRGGAAVSVAERDRVLAHAKAVASHMTSGARGNTKAWFKRRSARDSDFTSGRIVDTRVLDGACVFYRDDGRCALQVVGDEDLGHPWAIKPAVCLLWPLAVDNGKLDVGYAWFTRKKDCCSVSRRGELTVLEVTRPDGNLFGRMSRPGCSRGGGPPRA